MHGSDPVEALTFEADGLLDTPYSKYSNTNHSAPGQKLHAHRQNNSTAPGAAQ
jgi:hypothetical protein